MAEKTEVYHINSKYRIVFEKAAGVKTGDGFKVEANGDDIDGVEKDAKALYDYATEATRPIEAKE